MTMPIVSKMTDDAGSIFYDEAFRRVLEDHMTYLRTNPKTFSINIDPGKAYKFEGDFFSLLAAYNQPAYLHWIIMRMNNLTSSDQGSRDLTSVIVPDQTVVNQLRQSHMTQRRIT